MRRFNLPYDEHATSCYMCASVNAIDKLQRDYFAGRALDRFVPEISENEAAVIVADSLEADRVISLPLNTLFDGSFEPLFGPVSDWPRAVMAEVFLTLAEAAREMGDSKKHHDLWALSWASLEQNLNSPIASPLLWYEEIFLDVGQELRMSGDREAVDFFKRSLAHDLHFHGGVNAVPTLMDLAETHLWVGDTNAGLAILAALLRNDPSDVWIYNFYGLHF